MGLFTFFGNRNKPRPFNYQPIYWDPEKEEREKREKRIEEELGKRQSMENFARQSNVDLFENIQIDYIQRNVALNKEKKLENWSSLSFC